MTTTDPLEERDEEEDEDFESDVYAPASEGIRYRKTAYVPVAPDLDESPETEDHPDTGTGGRFSLVDLPRVPKLSHVVGPSAIMLGASLGSGETLFWPSLIAQNGWALYWAFWVGILTQFVVNTEIMRWTMATGESIFRSFERVHVFWPWFFLLAGFISLGWPGWAASAARVGSAGLGLGTFSLPVLDLQLVGWRTFGIVLMALIWASYQVSPVMYNVVERAQVALVGMTVVCAVVFVGVAGSFGELGGVPGGAVQLGTLPENTDTAVFLGGLAYAGAGGYLNLSQSLWAREKGFGMGSYQGRVKNPVIQDDHEEIRREGFAFRPTKTNLRRWKGWWRVSQLEHLLTFVVGLFVGATIMMAVAAAYAPGTSADALDMWLRQVGPQLSALGEVLLYLVLFLALFTTEYAIVESFVRNSADVFYECYGRAAGWSLARIFWGLLTVFAAWGILILSLPVALNDPYFLLVAAAAMSGVMMWPYIALTLVVNTSRLPEHLQPGWVRVAAMWWATAFFGFFSVLLIGETLTDAVGLGVFRTDVTVVGSNAGGYALWATFLVVQVVTMYTSARGKHAASGTVEDADEAAGLLR